MSPDLNCPICGNIPDYSKAYLDRDDDLSSEKKKLEKILSRR